MWYLFRPCFAPTPLLGLMLAQPSSYFVHPSWPITKWQPGKRTLNNVFKGITGGLHAGGLEAASTKSTSSRGQVTLLGSLVPSGCLNSPALQSRATDPAVWGPAVWGPTVSGYRFWISQPTHWTGGLQSLGPQSRATDFGYGGALYLFYLWYRFFASSVVGP